MTSRPTVSARKQAKNPATASSTVEPPHGFPAGRPGNYVQFSSRSPATLEKCFWLFVTRVAPRASA